MSPAAARNPLVKRKMQVTWVDSDIDPDGVYEVIYVGQGLIRFRAQDGGAFWRPLSEVSKLEDPD